MCGIAGLIAPISAAERREQILVVPVPAAQAHPRRGLALPGAVPCELRTVSHTVFGVDVVGHKALSGKAGHRHDLLLLQFPGDAMVGLSPWRARAAACRRRERGEELSVMDNHTSRS